MRKSFKTVRNTGLSSGGCQHRSNKDQISSEIVVFTGRRGCFPWRSCRVTRRSDLISAQGRRPSITCLFEWKDVYQSASSFAFLRLLTSKITIANDHTSDASVGTDSKSRSSLIFSGALQRIDADWTPLAPEPRSNSSEATSVECPKSLRHASPSSLIRILLWQTTQYERRIEAV